MERYAKRYINMKASHPEIAKRMPHEALNVILNTLDAYIEQTTKMCLIF